jgi:hypothetical protein
VVIEQQVERPVHGMLPGRRLDRVVGAIEEILLEAVSLAAGRRGSAAGRDAGDPLASVHTIGGQAGGNGTTVPGDPVWMEVQREATRTPEPADPVLHSARTSTNRRRPPLLGRGQVGVRPSLGRPNRLDESHPAITALTPTRAHARYLPAPGDDKGSSVGMRAPASRTHGDIGESKAMRLDPHDLVLSKLVANREKDIEFADAVIAARLVEVGRLIELAAALPIPEGVRRRVRATIQRVSGTSEPDSR